LFWFENTPKVVYTFNIMSYQIELVCKIGSMALINKAYGDVDYNIIARLSRELKPGYVLVTSGATEIGRIDYFKRNGKELEGGCKEDIKTDYASQGQIVLMETYRRFMNSSYSLRQFLVEHQHFNDEKKREHLKNALLRCPLANAVPIINYNDPVSDEENRKLEIRALREKHSGKAVAECVDNDETASEIACLLKPKNLIIFTGVDGIFTNVNDPDSLVKEISAKTASETVEKINYYQTFCSGASREGANGAGMKLEFIKQAVINGTIVFVANSKYSISEILSGAKPCTKIFISAQRTVKE